MTLALAKGLVVLGLLILWRTGLVSFGQALYFCLGGYAVGLTGLYFGITEATVLVALGILVSMAVATIVVAFAVVVIGGMGSVPGAVIGSLIIGMSRAATFLWIDRAQGRTSS